MTPRIAFLALALAACSDNDSSGVLGGALTVSGSVVDFQSGAEINGAASVTAIGLAPIPKTTVEGASFTREAVPENSTFQVLTSVAPTHRSTYSQTIIVIDEDLDGVKVTTVSEQFLS